MVVFAISKADCTVATTKQDIGNIFAIDIKTPLNGCAQCLGSRSYAPTTTYYAISCFVFVISFADYTGCGCWSVAPTTKTSIAKTKVQNKDQAAPSLGSSAVNCVNKVAYWRYATLNSVNNAQQLIKTFVNFIKLV